MFLCSKTLTENCTSAKIFNTIASDHKGLRMKLSIKPTKRGPGFFKFNASLLEINEFKREVSKLIEKTWTENQIIEDLRLRYDFRKSSIVEYIRKYSIDYAKQKRETEKISLNKLKYSIKKL